MNIFRGYIHFIVQWTLCWAEDFAFCGIQDETKAETLDKFLASRVRSLIQFSSVHSVMSNSLRPRGLKHARPPCPSPAPGAYSNSCPLSQWCHPTISSSAVLFSSCLQSFPASGSFQMSHSFASGGQSIGISASTSVLPMISFRMDWLDLHPRDSQESSPTPQFRSVNSSALSFQCSVLSYSPTRTSIHDHWKNHSLD